MKQRVIVSALIKKNEEYLFIQQNKEGGAYPNTLHIPGGGLEPGEDLYDAIRREIKEEVNISVKNLEIFDFDADVIDYKGSQTQLVFLRFLADYQDGEAKSGSDAEKIVWIRKDKIGNYSHNPPSIRLLTKLHLLKND